MHHQLQPFNIAVAALAGADEANMAGSMPVAKRRDSQQSVMLRLDDEVSGLIEAADTPADQAGAHSTKPEPISPVSGQLPDVQSRLAAAIVKCIHCGLGLCCAMQWIAVRVLPFSCLTRAVVH